VFTCPLIRVVDTILPSAAARFKMGLLAAYRETLRKFMRSRRIRSYLGYGAIGGTSGRMVRGLTIGSTGSAGGSTARMSLSVPLHLHFGFFVAKYLESFDPAQCMVFLSETTI
jgi:hypothetical protein